MAAVDTTALRDLPSDVLDAIIGRLAQRDQAALLCTSRSLYAAAFPHIFRMLHCACCGARLFPPSELAGRLGARPAQRVFMTLRPRAPAAAFAKATLSDATPNDAKDDFMAEPGGDLAALGLTVDSQRGAANFHVLAHLARTMFAHARFPLPAEASLVRALRCAACGVFVGFRKDSPSLSPPSDFVHTGFVDLCDLRGRPRSLEGTLLPTPPSPVACAGCRQPLFEPDDVLPWAHVLASNRLRDIDAYLEWECAGNDGSDPAFFVRRVRRKAVLVDNVRVERLRQGPMEIGDVRCGGCRKHVGWKFLAEAAEGGDVLHNYDQVGRFGVMRSAITPSEPRSAR